MKRARLIYPKLKDSRKILLRRKAQTVLHNLTLDFDLKNLESPQIVKSFGYPGQFDPEQRVAQQTEQRITNRQAYDLVYPTHKSYYEDKKFHVFDKNYQQVEDYLLKQFKSTLDSAIDYKENKNLVSVDDFDKSKIDFNKMRIQENAPMIGSERVRTSITYPDPKLDKNMKVTSSDPYGTIFGSPN